VNQKEKTEKTRLHKIPLKRGRGIFLRTSTFQLQQFCFPFLGVSWELHPRYMIGYVKEAFVVPETKDQALKIRSLKTHD